MDNNSLNVYVYLLPVHQLSHYSFLISNILWFQSCFPGTWSFVSNPIGICQHKKRGRSIGLILCLSSVPFICDGTEVKNYPGSKNLNLRHNSFVFICNDDFFFFVSFNPPLS